MSKIVDYTVAISLYNSGKTCKEIATYFTVKPGGLRDGLRRRGIIFKNPIIDICKSLINPYLVGYIAGLIDGEGSININHKKRQYWLTVDIATTSYPCAQWLKSIIGGHIRISDKPNEKHKTGYHWTVTSRQALCLLQLMLPYLRIKKEEALVAIRFQKRMKQINKLNEKELIIRADLKKELQSLR